MKRQLDHLNVLLRQLSLAFLIFSLCRVLFYALNLTHFNNTNFSLFLYGIRFDLVAIAFLFSPLIFLSLIPFPFRGSRWYGKVLSLSFYSANTVAIVLNLLDVAYFDFSFKRTTADFFEMISTGDDFLNLLPHYIIDFWYDYLLLISLLTISWFLHKKYCQHNNLLGSYKKKDYLLQSIIFMLFSVLTIIGMRGGLQYRPIGIVTAGQYTKAQNTPIVLNTPFTVLKTMFIDKIDQITYFSEEEVEKIYTPQKKINSSETFSGKNVVFIILESFAKEYVGGFNNGEGYTPFIDSLMKESYVFQNAYANGQRSIEALPCILAGIPQLMNSPYVLSNYAGSKLNGLPGILKNYGYNTSFYHGGGNGTMGFNGFVGSIGVDNYYGIDEYPNKDLDYDGLWGIFDEPYLQYYAKELDQKKEPFFSTIFTLSSHHPYTIPKQHIDKFPKGSLPLHETVGYTDYSLAQFFKSVQDMHWFNNTIFVFTADHSAQTNSSKYNSKLGRSSIPIFIYAPSLKIKGNNYEYFQQTDIPVTTMSLLGINEEIITFGNNAFGNEPKFAINYLNNSYQIAINNYFLIFNGEKTINFYDTKQDPLLTTDLINNLNPKQAIAKVETEALLKGIIQQYNNRIINNKLSI